MKNELLVRDLSWLSFNHRVLDEADRKRNTVADRIKFLSIACSNLDEFIKVRYMEDLKHHNEIYDEIVKQYNQIEQRKKKLCRKYKILDVVDRREISTKVNVEEFLQKLDTNEESLGLNIPYLREDVNYILISCTKKRKTHEDDVYLLTVPKQDIYRHSYHDDGFSSSEYAASTLVVEHFKNRYHNVDVLPFRIIRRADIFPTDILDPVEYAEQTLEIRKNSRTVAIEIDTYLAELCSLNREPFNETKMLNYIYMLSGLISYHPAHGMSYNIQYDIVTDFFLFKTCMLRGSDLMDISNELRSVDEKCEPFVPTSKTIENIFADNLAVHPYDDFHTTFLNWLEKLIFNRIGTNDEYQTTNIRITLYRVARNSELVRLLCSAARTRKIQVEVLIELKARFDEEHNLYVVKMLKDAGVTIHLTKPDIKTHAKLCVVTQYNPETDSTRYFSHIGTGNYSEKNASQYVDYSYFTANSFIGSDLVKLYDHIVGDTEEFTSSNIIYAPYNMRIVISNEINRQIALAENGETARIICKCNAITDESIARLLIKAAASGVKIILIVRGACIIQPQKNITIFSIVGKRLEHSRVLLFGKGMHASLYIGSADLMFRNLALRHELMLHVTDGKIRKRIIRHLYMYMKDNMNKRLIGSNYKYKPVKRKQNQKIHDVHKDMHKECVKVWKNELVSIASKNIIERKV